MKPSFSMSSQLFGEEDPDESVAPDPNDPALANAGGGAPTGAAAAAAAAAAPSDDAGDAGSNDTRTLTNALLYNSQPFLLPFSRLKYKHTFLLTDHFPFLHISVKSVSTFSK